MCYPSNIYIHIHMCACVCVCVCVRERERERERLYKEQNNNFQYPILDSRCLKIKCYNIIIHKLH